MLAIRGNKRRKEKALKQERGEKRERKEKEESPSLCETNRHRTDSYGWTHPHWRADWLQLTPVEATHTSRQEHLV